MIVTIDGPAGSGKSTVAQQLARRLGIAYLDTGAMYRAVALKALRDGVSLDEPARLAELARASRITFHQGPDGQRVLLDGQDVTDEIRTMRVNEATSAVARVPQVREALVARQRELAAELGSLVAEGRDQGSVVFPDAQVKFVLVGDIATRARRRYTEMLSAGQAVAYEEVLANLERRDQADEKHWQPLLTTGEAIRVDTTDLAAGQVVDRLHREVLRRQPRCGR